MIWWKTNKALRNRIFELEEELRIERGRREAAEAESARLTKLGDDMIEVLTELQQVLSPILTPTQINEEIAAWRKKRAS